MPTRRTVLVTAFAATLGLAACGSDDTDGAGTTSSTTTAAAASAFPVTIKHAFGETTIEAKPERVASVAWANHEVPLALGVVPVGMAKATWGDDDSDGVLPWVEETVTKLGGAAPALFDETDSIDFEGVANTNPDVILASYSGLTKEDYDKLTEIAPVVAYPKTAWTTSMNDMIEMNATALGLEAEGTKLVGDLEKQVADAAAKHPQLKGKSAMFAFVDPKDMSKIGYYTTGDPRAAFLEQLGLTTPKLVASQANATSFYQQVSAEEADKFADVDVIVTYGDTEGALVKAMQANKLLAKIPAVANGAIVTLVDNTPLAAAANPSPLDIGWGLDDYLGLLDAAVAKAK